MRRNPMRKSWVPKSVMSVREKQPIITKDSKGNALIMCPFCTPPHPINPETAGMCGTILQVRAIQQVYKAHSSNPKAICVKCGSGKGEMVLFQGALVHTYDCTPGTVTLSIPPKYSLIAKWVHGLKNENRVKKYIQKRYGIAVPVEEVQPDGKKTGKIFGYFFTKLRGANDRRTDPESQPTETLPAKPVS